MFSYIEAIDDHEKEPKMLCTTKNGAGTIFIACLSACLLQRSGLGWVGRRNNWWSPSPFFTATACHVTTQPPQFRLQCFAIHLKSGDMDSGNFFCQKFGKNMKKNKVWKFSTLLVLTTKTSLRFLFSCKCNESEIFWVESRFTERPWNLLRLNNWLNNCLRQNNLQHYAAFQVWHIGTKGDLVWKFSNDQQNHEKNFINCYQTRSMI